MKARTKQLLENSIKHATSLLGEAKEISSINKKLSKDEKKEFQKDEDLKKLVTSLNSILTEITELK